MSFQIGNTFGRMSKGKKIPSYVGFQKGNSFGTVNRGRKITPNMGFQKREKNSNYKGITIRNGYMWVCSLKNGHEKVCRCIVEIFIGRKLLRSEVVHHEDKNKLNDAPTNLMVFTNSSAHRRWHSKLKNVKDEEIIFDGRLLNNRAINCKKISQ